MSEILNKIITKSHEVFSFWQDGACGWAPSSASNKLEYARIDWLSDLTDCLIIWDAKMFSLTQGELLLAYANLGALVEGWLKLFYCIYYEDYSRNPFLSTKGSVIEPNDMKFEFLKQFSRDILWNQTSDRERWIEKIQYRRNAIHAFNNRDLGENIELINNFKEFYLFICEIDSKLPYPDK